MKTSIDTKAYGEDLFIALDESHIIFCSIGKEDYGPDDFNISFKNDDGKWTKVENMGL